MDNLQQLDITQSLKPRFVIVPGEQVRYLFDLNKLTQGCDQEIELVFVINQLSRLDLDLIGVGEVQANLKIKLELVGIGAQANVVGAFLLTKQSFVEFNIEQNHLTPDAQSTVRIRTALYDQSQFDYAGTIFIAEHASGTVANQENKNILLSSQAHVRSVPNIEVLNNDVKCGHGSAIGELDQEQIIYLMSRGLDKKRAVNLLLISFLGVNLNI